MSHSRTPSFFGFRTNKQPTDNQHQRAQSTGGPGNIGQQYLPPSSNTVPNPPQQFGQGQAALQNIPATRPQAQAPPQNKPQSLPPIPQSQPSVQQQQQQQQPQTPSQPLQQPQPQQSNMNITSNGSRPVTRSPSIKGVPQAPAPPPLHPEIRSVVQLTIAHAHKIYFSGPLVRRFERQPDGHKPTKDEGWTEVWAQLGGTTLSVWDMKEIQEASKQGREVPPSYINVTDAFIQVLGSVTVPATPTAPSKRYTNVITLNTAGSNLLLFSCPSTPALISWAAALRLAAWEKSRLEEIYTAHLIRITLNARDVPTTLVRGKMEGWARIRIAGQTDWKRVWLVVQEGSGIEGDGAGPAAAATIKRNRMSNLFSKETHASNPPAKPVISMFTSAKPKDRKKPLMTVHNVTQAFGVYPERPELINRSTLLKVEGTFGDDDMAATLRLREGWVLIMPELENGVGQAAEMLKWVVGLHDAFELYGRPEAWTWDPRDPVSLMFGYPVGPQKDNLFLEREIVEGMDPRDDRTSAIRSSMKSLLQTHLKPAVQVVQPRSPPRDMTASPPVLPPIAGTSQTSSPPGQQDGSLGPQLPPLSFGNNASAARAIPSRDRPLTPITERSSIMTHARTLSMDGPSMLSPNHASYQSATSPEEEQQLQPPSGQSGAGPIPGPSNSDGSSSIPTSAAGDSTSTSAPILDKPMSHSPPPGSNTLLAHPQNGNVMDASSTMTTISSAGIGTQSSINSMNQGISSTSLATSASPESPKVQGRTSFDIYSPPTSLSVTSLAPVSVQGKSSPAPLGPGPAQPFPNFLLEEARSKTQDSTSTKSAADVTSLEPVSDADQKPTSPNLPSGNWEQANVNLRPPPPTSNTARSSPTDEPNDFINEAGALYYMQQSDSVASGSGVRLQRTMQPPPDDDETSPDESDTPPNNTGMSMRGAVDGRLPRTAVAFNGARPNINTGTTAANEHSPPKVMGPTKAQSGTPIGRLSPTRSGLGRKPSGARAQSATTRPYNGAESISSQTLTETDENMPSSHKRQTSELAYDDPAGEAYAALTYLDLTDADVGTESSTVPLSPKIEPLHVKHAERASNSSPQQPGPATGDAMPYKSSFAPTNKAAERKLKAQAQQAAAHAATHRPGRANGKRKMKNAGAWESSEEEDEEEEEEEEDDDMDSDGQKPMARGLQSHQGLSSSANSLRPQIQTTQPGPNDYFQDVPPTPSHLRPARNLPVPPNRGQTGDFHPAQPMPRRQASDQYPDPSRRTHYEDGTPIRTQAEFPQPGAARQTVWSQVLDPGRTPGRAPQPDQPSNKDTFVQLEPSETMTKAFTPQGLLSAGLQDKEDRSARRQEELARESGASLINVPNKPPPPQTGLLGAITAHERERKREGGVGAALTEREREKRLAEERQRRFDDHQRQQLDQMQQGGSMYGGQFGFNPMMMGMNPMMGMTPMMTGNGMNPMMGGGMNPMMTGGGMAPFNPMMTGQMGYPGMMGGFNPQHMFAAQQAAQVYHQAMMAFSAAGSQVGGEGGNGGGAPSQVNPMNTGIGGMNPGMGVGMNPAMGGGMGGYDPRMSMMGMPMMGMGMGMGMGVASPQMNTQMPLGMQMTGMSTFDPKSSPGGANGSPAGELGLLPPNQNPQFSSRTSSPGRGSPLARGGPETADRGRPSRPTSPK